MDQAPAPDSTLPDDTAATPVSTQSSVGPGANDACTFSDQLILELLDPL